MASVKWRPFCLGLNVLTHNQLEMHRCVLSTVAADALVVKHQALSIHGANQISIALDWVQKKIHL